VRQKVLKSVDDRRLGEADSVGDFGKRAPGERQVLLDFPCDTNVFAGKRFSCHGRPSLLSATDNIS